MRLSLTSCFKYKSVGLPLVKGPLDEVGRTRRTATDRMRQPNGLQVRRQWLIFRAQRARVAQLDRVTASEAAGCGFNSRHAHHSFCTAPMGLANAFGSLIENPREMAPNVFIGYSSRVAFEKSSEIEDFCRNPPPNWWKY
jgi:hypothetical protein